MNWIKITPDTELPEDDVLVCWISWTGNNFHWEKGILERIGEQIKVIAPDGDVFGNPTHFMIITNPEE